MFACGYGSNEVTNIVFLKWGFTPCKAEESLRGMELKERQEKEEPKDKRCLLTLKATQTIGQRKAFSR